MTKGRYNVLRIDMITQVEQRQVYSVHTNFTLGNPSTYTLNLNYYDSGTAGKINTQR